MVQCVARLGLKKVKRSIPLCLLPSQLHSPTQPENAASFVYDHQSFLQAYLHSQLSFFLSNVLDDIVTTGYWQDPEDSGWVIFAQWIWCVNTEDLIECFRFIENPGGFENHAGGLKRCCDAEGLKRWLEFEEKEFLIKFSWSNASCWHTVPSATKARLGFCICRKDDFSVHRLHKVQYRQV